MSLPEHRSDIEAAGRKFKASARASLAGAVTR